MAKKNDAKKRPISEMFVSCDWRWLDYDLATEYLSLPKFEADRAPSPSQVTLLQQSMMTGDFNGASAIFAVAWFNNVLYGMNSNQTSTAVMAAEGKLPEYEVLYQTYKCETKEEMQRLYATFDANRPRTKMHLLGIFLTEVPQLKHIPIKTLRRASNGFWLWSFKYRTEWNKLTPFNKAQVIAKKTNVYIYREACEFMMQWFQGRRHMYRSPVMAALMETIRACKKGTSKKAYKKFWTEVADGGESLHYSDPRYLLREFLLATDLETSYRSKPKTKREKAMPELMYLECIDCYNAWRNGKKYSMRPEEMRGRVPASK